MTDTIERDDERAWLDSPAGCCDCGTGGPYDDTGTPAVCRYAYNTMCTDEPGTASDWTSCERHRHPTLPPVIDYEHDVVRTLRQVDDDVAAAVTGSANR